MGKRMVLISSGVSYTKSGDIGPSVRREMHTSVFHEKDRLGALRALLARECRLRPPARDAGNRISFAGLRGFAETRDSDLGPGPSGIARAIRRTRRGFSIPGRPRPSKSARPATLGDGEAHLRNEAKDWSSREATFCCLH